jgi:phage regulator Rha-like protein
VISSENIFIFFFKNASKMTIYTLIHIGGIIMANELLQIQNVIYEIRGQKVILDRDLAILYEVEVKRLNEAVKRNIERFPEDFMFQLTDEEWDSLRSQIVISNDEEDSLRSQIATSKSNRGGRRYLPYTFTEHGVLMLSNILNSTKAVNMSIEIIRVFNKLRKHALEQTSKNIRIEELHKLLMLHIENTDHKFSGYDKTIKQIVLALNNLIAEPPKTKRIGFTAEDT